MRENKVTDPAGLATPEETLAEGATWHPLQRFLFRFSFLYFIFYALSYPLDFIPLGAKISSWPQPIWERIVGFSGRHFFDLAPELLKRSITGSGDTTFDYVQLFCMVVMAALGAFIWWALDRRRLHYRRSALGLTIAVRYFVGAVIIFYGFGKVFHLQFSTPSLTRLVTPYGNSSPMGLAWAFMGASPAYSMFAGLGEVVGGLLLFFRRTTTLGALILIAVMSNVVMLNLCYDVPVKIFSSHLLIFTCALLIPDSRRLAAVALNRATERVEFVPLFSQRRMQVAATILNIAVVAILLQFNISMAVKFQELDSVKPPFYGLHNVESFVLNGEERPPLLTDEERWRSVIFVRAGRMTIQNMDGSTERFSMQLDLPQDTMTLSGFKDEYSEDTVEWTIERLTPETLAMAGTFKGQAIQIITRERDPEDFLLLKRGFRWISERPFNR